MSYYLGLLEGRERAAECRRHDREMARASRRRSLFRSLRPLWRECAIAWYRWALREISPLHPDVPTIVHRLRVLLDERGPEPMRAIARWL